MHAIYHRNSDNAVPLHCFKRKSSSNTSKHQMAYVTNHANGLCTQITCTIHSTVYQKLYTTTSQPIECSSISSHLEILLQPNVMEFRRNSNASKHNATHCVSLASECMASSAVFACRTRIPRHQVHIDWVNEAKQAIRFFVWERETGGAMCQSVKRCFSMQISVRAEVCMCAAYAAWLP